MLLPSLSAYTPITKSQALKFTHKHPIHLLFHRANKSHQQQHLSQFSTKFLHIFQRRHTNRKEIKQKEGEIMATSISATGFTSSFHGSWGSSIMGEDCSNLGKAVGIGRGKAAVRAQPMMKNVNEGKGLFAPIVVVTRNIIGKKRFNQLRGKAIALHSQVITEFCRSIGADAKQRQGLIRLAKKNGERLGFLA